MHNPVIHVLGAWLSFFDFFKLGLLTRLALYLNIIFTDLKTTTLDIHLDVLEAALILFYVRLSYNDKVHVFQGYCSIALFLYRILLNDLLKSKEH